MEKNISEERFILNCIREVIRKNILVNQLYTANMIEAKFTQNFEH